MIKSILKITGSTRSSSRRRRRALLILIMGNEAVGRRRVDPQHYREGQHHDVHRKTTRHRHILVRAQRDKDHRPYQLERAEVADPLDRQRSKYYRYEYAYDDRPNVKADPHAHYQQEHQYRVDDPDGHG